MPVPTPTRFHRVPAVPVVDCRTVYDYFVAMLGMPDDPKRINELREDYPLDSAVGDSCLGVIQAAANLIRHMQASYGGGLDCETVRQFALHACEVYAFG